MKYTALVLVLCGLSAVILAEEEGYEPPREGPANCQTRCEKILLPVCAQDSYGRNKTYPNECMIEYLNCKERTSFKLYSEGECADDPIEWVGGDDDFDQFDDTI